VKDRPFDLGDVLTDFFGKDHPLTHLSARVREESMSVTMYDYVCERCKLNFTSASGEDIISCPDCALGRCLARAYRKDKMPGIQAETRINELRSYRKRLQEEHAIDIGIVDAEISEWERSLNPATK